MSPFADFATISSSLSNFRSNLLSILDSRSTVVYTSRPLKVGSLLWPSVTASFMHQGVVFTRSHATSSGVHSITEDDGRVGKFDWKRDRFTQGSI